MVNSNKIAGGMVFLVVFGAFIFILFFDKTDSDLLKSGYLGFMALALGYGWNLWKKKG
jgi:hypothetical protein